MRALTAYHTLSTPLYSEDLSKLILKTFHTLHNCEHEGYHTLNSSHDLSKLILKNTQSDNDTTPPPQQQESLEVFINSLVVVIWVVNNTPKWYLGYITDIHADGDRYIVDHLERRSIYCGPPRTSRAKQ